MSEPFLAEIRMVGFNFAPRGFAFCDGQILPINQNQSLYSLLGTTYGGDGRTSFGLPDLRGRTGVHTSDEIRLGNRGGEERVTLTEAQIPQHGHLAASTDQATANDPTDAALASRPRRGARVYTAASGELLTLNGFGSAGSGQSHENMQPYIAIKFVIALQGLFPSRS